MANSLALCLAPEAASAGQFLAATDYFWNTHLFIACRQREPFDDRQSVQALKYCHQCRIGWGLVILLQPSARSSGVPREEAPRGPLELSIDLDLSLALLDLSFLKPSVLGMAVA